MHLSPSIDPHKIALARIVAVLFATLGLTEGVTLGRIPKALHRTVLRVLQPAESAVRRLVAIVARTIDPKTIKLKPSRRRAPRVRPEDLARARLGLAIPFREEPARKEPARKERDPAEPAKKRFFFRLFDQRQRFSRKPSRKESEPGSGPRLTSFGNGGYRTVSFAIEPSPKKADGLETAAHLVRRLQALKAALEDLPGQALRMAHAQARREASPHAKYKSPLRLGPAPGARKKPVQEIDHVLERCHWLAREALAKPAAARPPEASRLPDTS